MGPVLVMTLPLLPAVVVGVGLVLVVTRPLLPAVTVQVNPLSAALLWLLSPSCHLGPPLLRPNCRFGLLLVLPHAHLAPLGRVLGSRLLRGYLCWAWYA